MPSKGPSRSKTEEAKVPLQAVVLADSFTHRFRPITLERPKTLLPLANVPMIEYTLEFLASNGVEEVFVFCCAHADQLTQYIENSAWSNTAGFVVHTIVSTNCISAGEALRLIDHKHVIRSDFILISGDTVANMDLRRAHARCRCIADDSDSGSAVGSTLRRSGIQGTLDLRHSLVLAHFVRPPPLAHTRGCLVDTVSGRRDLCLPCSR